MASQLLKRTRKAPKEKTYSVGFRGRTGLYGVKYITAPSAKAARAEFRNRHPDIIIRRIRRH